MSDPSPSSSLEAVRAASHEPDCPRSRPSGNILFGVKLRTVENL